MRVSNDTLLSEPVDLSADWNSPPIWLGHIAGYSIQLVFSGTPSGAFRLQVSNDKETSVESAAGVTNWTTMTGSTQLITEAGDHTWSIADSSYRWARVQWLAGVGTGSLDGAQFNAKGN